MTEIQVHDSAIRMVRLDRFLADDEDEVAATAELLAAADDFARGWLVPLGVDLRVDDHSVLSIKLSVYWDAWVKSSDMFEAAVQRVLHRDRGWELWTRRE